MSVEDSKYVIAESARKYGISDEDIMYAVQHVIDMISPPKSPVKVIYIGFDASGRNLEGVTIQFSDGVKKIIHAMKLRKSFVKLIEEYKNEQR